MPTPATMRVVQMEPGPWPILMALAPQSARNSVPAALVTLPAMMVRFREGAADEFHHVADASGVAVGGGDGDGVDVFVDEVADVGEDFFAVEGAVGQADG